jgi:pimeloyl-ACP methyl ester carboxylesterase
MSIMRNTLPIVFFIVLPLLGIGLIAGALIILGGVVVNYVDSEQEKPKASAPFAPSWEERSLSAARQHFETIELPTDHKAPHGPPADIPDAEVVYYPTTEQGKCAAYLSEGFVGKRQPAIVWAHPGFAGIGAADWERTKVFRDAGCVVLIPSFRGEHLNPGRFEMFYGEVDDLLRAVNFAGQLRSVDPNAVYVVGYGSGATLSLLAAAMGPSKVRAFFAIAGLPSLDAYLQTPKQAPKGWVDVDCSPPFNTNQPLERLLRSAQPFAAAMRRPTYYISAAADDRYAEYAAQMEERARQKGASFHHFTLDNTNHADMLEPVLRRISVKIAKHGSDFRSTIEFAPGELQRSLTEKHR